VRVAWRASFAGLLLLTVFAAAGGWVLRYLFHVELYALDVAAGAVLFLVGLATLREGVFYAMPEGGSLTDISIVPLASPLIAGPATLSAAITQAQRFGSVTVLAAIAVAVLVNLAAMLVGIRLARSLARSHTVGALVRVLGLFIASIGASMFLAGIQLWFAQLPGR